MGRTDNATALLESLRNEGYRMTKLRSALLRLFSVSRSPIAVVDMTTTLHGQGITVNKTTIYRELEFLLGKGLIRELDLLEGKKRYELSVEPSHHHHLVCTKCNSVRCVEMPNDLNALERKLRIAHGFKVTHHILEFFGLCRSCSRG